MIKIITVGSKKAVKEFVNLPYNLYAGNPNWIPPIYSEELKFHRAGKQEDSPDSEIIRFLALSNQGVVGRITGIINHKYNNDKNEQYARFCFFECIDSYDVSNVLLSKVEEWASNKGMKKIIGPFGYSDRDPQGIMIDGFDKQGVYTINYNIQYYPKLIKNMGYTRFFDLVDYEIEMPLQILPTYAKIHQRIKKNGTFKLKELRSRKQLKEEIVPVFKLINQCYADVYGFSQLTEDEMNQLGAKFIKVLNPEFIKVVYAKNELVAFLLSMPDISKALKKSKGKLFPWGFLFIQNELRTSKKLIFLLGAIHPKYRGLGIDAFVMYEMLLSAQKHGITKIDSHLEMENNFLVRRQMEKLGGKVVRKFRVYQKDLLSSSPNGI